MGRVKIDPKLLIPYIDRPREFVEDILFRYYPTDPKPVLNRNQIKLFDAVTRGEFISVRSGRGRGKTAGVAFLCLWFLATRPRARVVCTAPKADQLSDILWTEIAKWLHFSPLKEMLVWGKEKIECVEMPEGWFAVARTAKNKENFSGFHEEHQMFIVDESSGVPDEISETIEATQTSNKATDSKKEIITIHISNPTKITGYFYKTQMLSSWRDMWIPIHFDATDGEIKRDMGAMRLIRLYGRDHDIVQVSVFGNFPSGNPRAVLSLSDVWDAVNRDVVAEGAIEIGVDVARFGDDQTIICYRHGYKVFPLRAYKKQDTYETEQNVLSLVRELRAKYNHKRVIRIKIDDSTMGCVTRKCKLLTPDGWRGPDELKVGDKIYSKNSFGIMTEETVLEVWARERVNVIEADGCEFAWAHWLPYRTRNEHGFKMGDWETALGKDRIVLDNEFKWQGRFDSFIIPEAAGEMPYGGKKIYKKERVISPEKFSNFLGWFLSEGCVTGNRITISQRAKNPYCDLIKDAILGVNGSVTVSTSRDGYSNYTFTDRWLSAWLKKNCYASAPYHSFNKRIPRYVKDSAVAIIRIFLNSFRMGDGHFHKGAANYSTSSSFLADDLLEIIVKSGRAGIKRINHAKGSKGRIGKRVITREHDNYRVSEWKTMTHIGIRGAKARKIYREDAVYSIRISGETQLFINKFDKGKIFWSHNGGVVDHLRRNTSDGIDVIPCLFGGAGNDYYSNSASVMWAELKDMMGKLGLPQDDALIEELCGRNWETSLDNRSRQKIEPKENFKERIKRSPDRADALVLCCSNSQDKPRILPKLINLRDSVFRNVVIPFNFLNIKRAEIFGSVWHERDMKENCLVGLWDKETGHLTLFYEGVANVGGPDAIITSLTNVVNMYNEQHKTWVKPRRFIWYANRAMFGISDQAFDMTNIKDGPYLAWQNKHMIALLPNFHFDLNGAILYLNRMLDEHRITILPDLIGLKTQLETWVIDNERPAVDGYGLCMALGNIISMLHQTKRMDKKPAPLVPYGVTITKDGMIVQKGSKEKFLNKTEKIFAEGHQSKIKYIIPKRIDGRAQ